jgi:hypothetical protein
MDVSNVEPKRNVTRVCVCVCDILSKDGASHTLING